MKLKYTGRGAFIGVPARDLNENDLRQLPEGLTVDILTASGLYQAETFDQADAAKIMPRVKRGSKKDGE